MFTCISFPNWLERSRRALMETKTIKHTSTNTLNTSVAICSPSSLWIAAGHQPAFLRSLTVTDALLRGRGIPIFYRSCICVFDGVQKRRLNIWRVIARFRTTIDRWTDLSYTMTVRVILAEPFSLPGKISRAAFQIWRSGVLKHKANNTSESCWWHFAKAPQAFYSCS